jgi:hypothetical protein
MTFFEFHSYSRSVEFKDELAWRRESQGLSLLYNINRGKGKSMSPEDFNPYTQINKKRKGEEMTAESIEALKNKITDRHNKAAK